MTKANKSDGNAATVIWGKAVEEGDSIKVPRALIYLERYAPKLRKRLTPRQFRLLLVLAAE